MQVVFCVSRMPTISTLVANFHDAAVNLAGDDGAAARDREHVFDGHQERLVERTLRGRDVGVDGSHQLQDGLFADFRIAAFDGSQGGARDDRNVVAREVVGRQQFANFEFDELEQFLVVDHVDLVQEDDESRNADLTGEQDVLAGLRHRAVSSRHDQDAAVHLRRARDHVLHVVGVSGAVDVSVVTVGRLVLDVSRVDRDAAGFFFRRSVDVGVLLGSRAARFGEDDRDRRRQRRLAVVNVANRANVDVRLRTREFFLTHVLLLRSISGLDRNYRLHQPLSFSITSFATALGTAS